MKDLGRKCFRLRREATADRSAFTKLDAGEIRRIKKSAYAKATADMSAFVAGGKKRKIV